MELLCLGTFFLTDLANRNEISIIYVCLYYQNIDMRSLNIQKKYGTVEKVK